MAITPLCVLSIPIVHESGHAVTAHLTGLRVVGFEAGVFSAKVTASGWRVTRTRRWKWISGVHVMETGPAGQELRRQVSFIAAGPCAAIALAGMYAMLGWLAPTAESRAAGALRLAALLALADGVINLVPVKATDGWRLVTWLRQPDAMRLRVATSTLLLSARLGVRPAQWPPSWVRAAAELPPGEDFARFATARYLAYLAARDNERIDEAWRCLSASLAYLPRLAPAQGNALLLEAALHQAWALRDPVEARHLLCPVERSDGLQVHVLRAFAAIHLAEGNYSKAVSACDKILQARDSSDQAGISAALKEWTCQVRAKALDLAGKSAATLPVRSGVIAVSRTPASGQ